MVVLSKIYTRTGDEGFTSLGDGLRLSKADLRIEAYGTVDETNATLGLVRLHTNTAELGLLHQMLGQIQNELFDLGADLCVPEDKQGSAPALRIIASQWQRLERDIDQMNEKLAPLRSFVLPGGEAAAAYLHLARTVARRGERLMVALKQQGAPVNPEALIYINRLSDFLFVASRYVNANGSGDVLWQPGATR